MQGRSRHDLAYRIATDITRSWSAELAAERAVGKESAPDALQVMKVLTGVGQSLRMVCPLLMAGSTVESQCRSATSP